MMFKRTRILLLLMSVMLLLSCNNNTTKNLEKRNDSSKVNTAKSEVIKVEFQIKETPMGSNEVVEDKEYLKQKNKQHTKKYYSYMPSDESTKGDFIYLDVTGQKHIMYINKDINANLYKWNTNENVLTRNSPVGHKMSYGIDVSKHNGDIDFNKVKNAGFEFVIIRVAYRGYGKKGKLVVDEKVQDNLVKAKNAGLKIGAYVFSQAINEKEAIEEAKLAIDLLKDTKLDLPIFFDPETIRNDIARTDDIDGEQFTKNAIAFMDEIKKANFETGFYSNMVWEDYYLDMSRLKDYTVWYADYSELPQTPYDFKFWQFSESGIVDGIDGAVDLNVWIK